MTGLVLDHNNLTLVEDNAFLGNERNIMGLALHNNRLSYFPSALGRLSNLYSLSLEENYIMKYDAKILKNLRSLRKISYGSSSVKRWPTEMKYVDANQISIYGINVRTLPDEVFPDDLFILNMTSTSLESLSSAISNKPMLYKLLMQDNKALTATGLAKGMFENLPQLGEISITNSNLTTLPLIFDNLPKLTNLNIDGCPIKILDNSTFKPNKTAIYYFMLANSDLDHVPKVLSHLSGLMTLFLTNGKIQTINDNDFENMQGMRNLHLSGNPISNISDRAFRTLTNLRYLLLDNTQMNTIPKAILNPQYMQYVGLDHAKVECSCNSLGWMKQSLSRIVNKIQIVGDCFNIAKTLSDYIHDDVRNCSSKE